MIPIWIVHALESFDLGVYVFNDNPLSDKTPVVIFSAVSKRMELAGFVKNLAFGMNCIYPNSRDPHTNSSESDRIVLIVLL
jgi:hypothetical protein